MTDTQLHKLNRRQLLELMIEQSKRIDELEKELAETKAALEKKTIDIADAGSIAEASMKLNKVFEAAQQAADQYLQSVREQAAKQQDEKSDS